jgi:hypothetical protein
MKLLRCGVLVLTCSAAIPLPARAADIVIDGEAACLSIRGAWGYSSCTVDRLIVPAGTRMVIASGVGFYPASLINDGVLETNGRFDPGPFTNRGTLKTTGPRSTGASWSTRAHG